MGDSIDKGYLYICEVFSSEVVQRYLEGSPVRTSVSLFIYIAPVVSSGRVMAAIVSRSLRAYVSHSWPVGFGGGFRVCRADAETDHKCHRGGKPVGRGRWRRKEVETGDEGLSATGTSSH